MSIAALIATVITTPDLPLAACVTERETFDACTDRQAGSAYDDAYGRAVRICAGCAALGDCRRWVTGLPVNRRPYGVTAGLIRRGRWR
jgi:hypothetical protein